MHLKYDKHKTYINDLITESMNALNISDMFNTLNTFNILDILDRYCTHKKWSELEHRDFADTIISKLQVLINTLYVFKIARSFCT